MENRESGMGNRGSQKRGISAATIPMLQSRFASMDCEYFKSTPYPIGIRAVPHGFSDSRFPIPDCRLYA